MTTINSAEINEMIKSYNSGNPINARDLIIKIKNNLSQSQQMPENIFYKIDDSIKLGSDVGKTIQERITNVYYILTTLYELTDNVKIRSFSMYNGTWRKNENSLPFSSNILIFTDVKDNLTIIYDNRDIKQKDYPLGLTLQDYFNNHSYWDFTNILDEGNATNDNYCIECLLISLKLLNEFDNVIYITKNNNISAQTLIEKLDCEIKRFYFVSALNYSGNLLRAFNVVNNLLTTYDNKDCETDKLNIWC